MEDVRGCASEEGREGEERGWVECGLVGEAVEKRLVGGVPMAAEESEETSGKVVWEVE